MHMDVDNRICITLVYVYICNCTTYRCAKSIVIMGMHDLKIILDYNQC